MDPLKRIEAFLADHHVMTLATVAADHTPRTAHLFYAYDPDAVRFVVASDSKTEHMRNVARNAYIAAAVALETKTVGKVQGIQIEGVMRAAEAEEGALYFKAFPYARVMSPELWVIEPREMKLTDNRLGFGKKLIWTREPSA
jgi:uncharacterized protein